MQEISDSLIVGFLHRPIGFRSIKSKEVTVHEVRKWIDETKPSPIKKISIGGVGAIVLTVIGSVTGFLGIRKDNSIGKWLGGIFTLIGVGAAINAIFGAPKLRTGGEKEVDNDRLPEEHEEKVVDKETSPLMREENITIKDSNGQVGDMKGDSLEGDALINSVVLNVKQDEVSQPAINNDSETNKKVEIKVINKEEFLGNFKSLSASFDYKGRRALVKKAKDEFGEPQVIDCLFELANNKSEKLERRSNAVSVLGSINDKKAPECLVQLIGDKNNEPEIRKEAVVQFGFRNLDLDLDCHDRTNGIDLFSPLIQCMNDKTEDIATRFAAILSLAMMEDAKGIEALSSYIINRNNEASIRQKALKSLAVRYANSKYLGGDKFSNTILPLLEYVQYKNDIPTMLALRYDALELDHTLPNPVVLSTLTECVRNKDDDGYVRGEAAIVLGYIYIRDPSIIDPIITCLHDKFDDPYMRAKAATALGIKRKEEKAVQALVDCLEDKSDDSDVRAEAANSLGEVKTPKVIELLSSTLKDKEEKPVVRVWAASGLGKTKDRKVVKVLTDCLYDENDFDPVRSAVALALGDIGGSEVLKALQETIHDSSSPCLERAIPQAIEKIEKNQGTIKSKFLKELRLIAEAHSSEQCSLRDKLLREYDKFDVLPLLIEFVSDEVKEEKHRTQAVACLGKIEDTTAVKPLIHVMESKNNGIEVRSEAAGSLGVINDKNAIPSLILCLGDKTNDPEVRSSAASALSKFKDLDDVRILVDVFNDRDENPHIRSSAVIALGLLGRTEMEEDLVKCLHDKTDNPKVRGSAACALGKIGDRNVMDILKEVSGNNEEDPNVKFEANDAVWKIKLNQ